MPGTLAPDAVGPFLRGRFGRPMIYEAVCASTQRLLDDSLPEGAVAVCEEQTGGRGRLGRSWEAPPGTAILCSILLRPPATRPIPELALVAGLATTLAVEAELGREAGIKWPNDVLVGGRKVAGILAEARGSVVVLGIGLNVGQAEGELPDTGRTPAASLFSLDGRPRERAPLLAALLGELERQYNRWIAEGLVGLIDLITARDVLRGRRVTIGETAGLAQGIAADGRLVVLTPTGETLVASGEAILSSYNSG